PSPWRVACPVSFLAVMKYSTLPCAIAAGICASQVSPSVRVSGMLVKVVLPCGRTWRTASATGDSLLIFVRTRKSRPSGGEVPGLLCSTDGGEHAGLVGDAGLDLDLPAFQARPHFRDLRRLGVVRARPHRNEYRGNYRDCRDAHVSTLPHVTLGSISIMSRLRDAVGAQAS